jgi:hypothetical protein
MVYSEFKKLENEYNKKLKLLQKKCPHKRKTNWIEQFWAPGHSSNVWFRKCKRCDLILEKRNQLIIREKVN